MIFDFLLFLLSFLLSYAFLVKTKILPGKTSAVIAFVIAFYSLSASVFYSENIVQILAYSLLILFIIFIVVVIHRGLKKDEKKKGK